MPDAIAKLRELPLLTVSQVSRILSLSPSSIRDHAAGRRRPKLPHIRIGKSIRVSPAQLQTFIQENTR